MTSDYFDLNIKGSTVEITAKDCGMMVGMEVFYDDFIDTLNDNDAYLRDWLIDKVQELLKSKYQLEDIPITASEFEKTNAILEELRS